MRSVQVMPSVDEAAVVEDNLTKATKVLFPEVTDHHLAPVGSVRVVQVIASVDEAAVVEAEK